MLKLVTRLLLLSLLVLTVACGKRGRPKPPENFAPSPVRYLDAQGQVSSISLTWEAPLIDASGDALEDLAYFVVKRSLYERGERPDFDDLSEIVAAEDSAEAPAGSADERKKYLFQDQDVEPGKSYDYLILGVNEDGVEGESAGVVRVRFVGESSIIERR